MVCCAGGDAEALQPTLDALRDDGHEIDSVDRIDEDPKRLIAVIEAHEGEGLYVLCRSPRLGRERVEELREILLARHIPFARTLTVAVGGRGGLLDRIRSGLRRANARVRSGGGRRAGASDRPSTPRARTATPRPTPAAAQPKPASTVDEEPTKVGKRSELSSPIPVNEPSSPAPQRPPLTTGTRSSPPKPPPVRARTLTPPPSSTQLESPPASVPAATPSPTPPSSSADAPQPVAEAPSPATPAAPATPSVPATPATQATPSVPATPATQATPSAPATPATQAPAQAGISMVEELDPDLLTDDPSASLTGAAISMSDLDLSDLDDDPVEVPPPLDTTAVGTPPPMITGETMIGPAPAGITGDTMVGEVLPDELRKAAEAAAAAWSVDAPTKRRVGSTPSPAPSSTDADEPSTTPMPRLQRPQVHAGGTAPPVLPGQPSSGPPNAVEGAASAPITTPRTSPVAAINAATPPPLPAVGMAPPATPPLPAAGPSLAPGSSVAHGAVSLAPPRNTLPIVLGVVALGLLGLVITLAVWPSDDPNDEVAASPATPTPTEPTQTPKPVEPPTVTDEPPPPPPTYAVVEALRTRQVRALDVLLIASEFSKPGDFVAASSYCSGLEVEGLAGWRLPRVGELTSLDQAEMIDRGYYWSSTAADTFGDAHFAWNERRNRAEPHESNAVAVCVRGEAGGS
ncbi:MAG: hypothetical protein K0V04_13460 [Deltaproteobacteria bacterium]|nr:hypothetical protein [Deltaproteobacteria bacterium]